ncbi:hypothetical protein [Salinicola aestuarinus]|uniref:hypothetical protein n=1 Tax=Salinicola aestuarinus TaxID=1949082 RepID=UPI000DA113C5|nr:hypothetical protein [Salinicola aestuarinus]
MDSLTFISSLVRSLAWPVFALILALLFRDQILQFGTFIKKLRAGPFEAELEHDLEQLRSLLPMHRTAAGGRADDDVGFLTTLAKRHPRTAILESWTQLEQAARAAVRSQQQGEPGQDHVAVARLPEPLVRAGLIDQPQVTLYHELRRLRNDVAHATAHEPTREAASAFVALATTLHTRLTP